jgi:hypothetical protein
MKRIVGFAGRIKRGAKSRFERVKAKFGRGGNR